MYVYILAIHTHTRTHTDIYIYIYTVYMYMIVRALAEIFSAATRLGGSVRDVTFRFGIGGVRGGRGF